MPMKTIDVWADTEGIGTCRDSACQKRILWAQIVKSGRRMCFEADAPVLKTAISPTDGRAIHSYDLADNHWATCPGAKGFH